MDLRSGLPYWRAIDPPAETAGPALSGDAQCEVAILGGGITGALVGYYLAREGVDALVVDRRDFAAGSTAGSTGLLQYEIDMSLADLIGKVGEQNAVRAYRRGLSAIDDIERLVEELRDSCGFARRETIYFASHWWHVPRLRREFAARRVHGFDVAYLDRARLSAISSIRAPAAIRATGDGQIDPYRFTRRLIASARNSGLRAYARTSVDSIEECPCGVN